MQRGETEKLPSGRWRVRWYDAQGNRQSGGTYALRRDALLALQERVPSHRNLRPANADVTLDELAERFLATYEAKLSTRKRVTYQLGIAQRAFGSYPIRDLTSEDIARWRLTLPERSRSQIHSVLSMALDRAQRWDLLGRNPAKDIRNPSTRSREALHFSSWSDVQLVDQELGHYRGLATFATGTGLRPAEWMGLQWDDVDVERRVITVRNVWAGGELTHYLKTRGSLRHVPLRSIALDALPEPSTGFVWKGAKGSPIDLRVWRRRFWAPAVDAAGLDRIPPYGMRHTYASMSLAAGINLFTLARRMGTSVKMIDATYGHLFAEQGDTERDLLDAYDEASETL
jgi:integrase